MFSFCAFPMIYILFPTVFKEILAMVKSFLLRRGPDNYGEKRIVERRHSGSSCDLNSSVIHLSAVVLHLRGECIAKQPVEDTFGNILAWNGEIFAGLEVGIFNQRFRLNCMVCGTYRSMKCGLKKKA